MFKVSLVLSCLAALSQAWTPGTRDRCDSVMTMGGSYVLPHEKYCQVFLSCDLAGRQYHNLCPAPGLFAYGEGVSTCAVLGSTMYTCPKWPCSTAQHVGSNYPDVCCRKYWTCERIGKFSQRECPAGQTFNMNAEVCQDASRPTDQCRDDTLCYDEEFRSPNANKVYDCPNSPISTDTCSYMTEGWTKPRKCPAGTAYDHSRCSCTTFAEQCSFLALSKEDFNKQKKPDSLCRASGRVDFSRNPLLTSSYKLPSGQSLSTPVDHYYMNRSVSFSQGGANYGGSGALIYDYYYADNTLYAPIAFSITVKFNRPNGGFSPGTRVSLLENVFYNGAEKFCQDATISIFADFQNLVGGQHQWKFTLTAKGADATRALTATTDATILGGADDYYRVIYIFNDKLSGSVMNAGTSGRTSGTRVTMQQSTVALGSKLGTNKCGFSIGRDLDGRITEFQTFEGCVNPQNQNLDGLPN